MVEIDPNYEGRINRMRNLPMYKDASDEEIYQHLLRKEEEQKGKKDTKNSEDTYSKKYNKLFDDLKKEYIVDMNESNDYEALKNLVRHTLQLEYLDEQIQEIHKVKPISSEDSRTLKNLGDIQRSLIQSINDLQNSLGVSRTKRKEKASDDVPQFIAGLKAKAKDFYDRKTQQVNCEKCKIELGRYWLNFPKQKNTLNFSLECWKCKETIVFVG